MGDFFVGVLRSVEAFLIRENPGELVIDLVDIFLMFFIIYRILLLLRGTRAMQMVAGLGFVVAIYWLAKRVGLVTVWSALDTLLGSIILVVVILFQDDIRRALMRFGQRPFIPGLRPAQDTHMFEEVIKATTALAQKRIGALIVFERDASLGEFIEPGVELDASVQKDLLYSLFIPSFENPMHDGAVVIRGGRVWQAGAFLPLTASARLDRALGTRHRAALGITEETDAVAVAVSEERGKVSLAFKGNLIRDLDPSALREALRDLFQTDVKREKKDEVPKVAVHDDGGRESMVELTGKRPSERPGEAS